MLASPETIRSLTGAKRPGWQARKLGEMGIPYRVQGRNVLVLEDDVRRYIRGETGRDERSEPEWSKINAQTPLA